MSAPKHTPTPWQVYEGGNFVKIGSDGYDAYVEKESYLAGPFCVGETNCHQSKDHDFTMELALANATFIVHAVNSYAERHLVLQECLAYFSDVEADDALGHALFKRIEKLLHPAMPNMLADGNGSPKLKAAEQGS